MGRALNGRHPRSTPLVALALVVGAVALGTCGCGSSHATHNPTVHAPAADPPSRVSEATTHAPTAASISYTAPSTGASVGLSGASGVPRSNAPASTSTTDGTHGHQRAASRTPSASTHSTGAPRDEISDLTAAPASGTPSICEDVYYPGERLRIGASGFLPHTPVRVFVESRGVARAEQELASLRADGTGAIAATVEIPLQATGFLPRGAHTALIFLDAIGLGADGASHAGAIQMAGLAPPGSPCAVTPH
jgi:hypothetical protein